MEVDAVLLLIVAVLSRGLSLSTLTCTGTWRRSLMAMLARLAVQQG